LTLTDDLRGPSAKADRDLRRGTCTPSSPAAEEGQKESGQAQGRVNANPPTGQRVWDEYAHCWTPLRPCSGRIPSVCTRGPAPIWAAGGAPSRSVFYFS
jgi:hypothetical protein